jgi:hypothetical protein
MIEMTDEELKRCKEFLDYFDVDYNIDVIELTSGGNSCIMNPKTEWQEFLGCSINSVAEAVAKKLNKKTIYIEDEYTKNTNY